MMNKDELKFMIENSIFNTNYYRVDISLDDFNFSLSRYIKRDEATNDNLNYLSHGIPLFQRDNDKWTLEQKIKFIENVILGFRTTIMLFTTKYIREKQSYSRCWILDGLQRVTAVTEFIEGKFKVFNDTVDYAMFESLNKMCLFGIQIYTFEDDIEAASFYIQMNKGITHSEQDILRAVNFIIKNKVKINI
jgi:hypothetical protein